MACTSENIGEEFINAEVPHVICIKKESFIDDAACVFFSKNFYEILFKYEGDQCAVCSAFNKVKSMVFGH